MSLHLYVDTDTILEVTGVKNSVTGVTISDAAVEAIVQSISDMDVEGQSLPIVLAPVDGSAGDYRGVLSHSLDIIEGREYFLIINIDAGEGLFSTIKKLVKAKRP